MDRGAWQATVHGVAESQTRLKRLSTHTCMHTQYFTHNLKEIPESQKVFRVHLKVKADLKRREAVLELFISATVVDIQKPHVCWRAGP